MALNSEQKKEYIASEGSRCPYCQSGSLEGYGGYDADADYITSKVECISCGKTWTDLYKLAQILEE